MKHCTENGVSRGTLDEETGKPTVFLGDSRWWVGAV